METRGLFGTGIVYFTTSLSTSTKVGLTRVSCGPCPGSASPTNDSSRRGTTFDVVSCPRSTTGDGCGRLIRRDKEVFEGVKDGWRDSVGPRT